MQRKPGKEGVTLRARRTHLDKDLLTTNEARREAGPRALVDLTSDQKRALDSALFALNAIATVGKIETRSTTSKPSFLPVIDERRYNRTLLIDGARGSGKTSLLVTLLDKLVKQFEENSAKSNHSEPLIVPLQILDLQPIPRTTSLPLLVANCLRSVLESVESAKPIDAGGQRLVRGAIERWAQLRDSVALGGDLGAGRLERAETETFVLEFDEAGRNRLLARPFHNFVESLVVAFQHHYRLSHRPLFVIPVDDADMNVEMSPALLDTVSSLAHPSLVYVLTGDSDLFKLTLRDRFLGILRSSSRAIDGGSVDGTSAADFQKLQGLARQVYDKQIPAANRFELRALAKQDRLTLVKSAISPHSAPLIQLIEPYPWRRAGRERETVEQDSSRMDSGVSALTIALPILNFFDEHSEAALPSTVREIRDLRTVVDAPGADGRTALAILEHLWSGRTDDAAMNMELAHRFRRRLSVHWDGQGTAPRIHLNTSQITRHTQTTLQAQLGAKLLRSALRVNRVDQYRFSLASAGENTAFTLDEGLCAAIVLANDIVASTAYGAFIGSPSLAPTEFGFPLVQSVIHFEDALADPVAVCWPVPDWEAFSDFTRVDRIFRTIVAAVERTSRGKQDLFLALGFIAAVAGAAFGQSERILGAEGNPRGLRPSPDSLMKSIASSFKRLSAVEPRYARDRANLRWLKQSVWLMTLPESGLDADTANELWSVLSEFTGLPRMTGLQNARIDRLAKSRLDVGKELGDRLESHLSPSRLSRTLRQSRSVGDQLADMLTMLDASPAVAGKFRSVNYIATGSRP